MQKPNGLLFVYGTLKRGQDNRWSRLLWEGAEFLGEAWLPGRLYRLGSYPGLREPTGPAQRVHGELARLRKPQELLRALDGYEGAEFERVLREVQLEGTGETHSAWVYVHVGPVQDKDLIDSGKFSSHP